MLRPTLVFFNVSHRTFRIFATSIHAEFNINVVSIVKPKKSFNLEQAAQFNWRDIFDTHIDAVWRRSSVCQSLYGRHVIQPARHDLEAAAAFLFGVVCLCGGGGVRYVKGGVAAGLFVWARATQ